MLLTARATATQTRRSNARVFYGNKFVLRSAQQDNAIVRHFRIAWAVCRFNRCLWLEDPVVLHQNEHKNVKFMCADTVRNDPVKTIRMLPYKV